MSVKVVIQCAGRKRPGAGRLKDEAGVEVTFVARPDRCDHPLTSPRPYRPDDPDGPGAGTWRDVLTTYNERYRREGANPNRLLPAGDLYTPRVYHGLVNALGPSNVYILSAGWGLVRSDFLLPDYDITFSTQAAAWARRGKREDGTWRDFNHLRDADLRPDELVHFFGGRDYLPLYHRLVDDITARKVIHHKAGPDRRPGYEYQAYTGPANTNWHYPAAEAFVRTHLGAKV